MQGPRERGNWLHTVVIYVVNELCTIMVVLPLSEVICPPGAVGYSLALTNENPVQISSAGRSCPFRQKERVNGRVEEVGRFASVRDTRVLGCGSAYSIHDSEIDLLVQTVKRPAESLFIADRGTG